MLFWYLYPLPLNDAIHILNTHWKLEVTKQSLRKKQQKAKKDNEREKGMEDTKIQYWARDKSSMLFHLEEEKTKSQKDGQWEIGGEWAGYIENNTCVLDENWKMGIKIKIVKEKNTDS